MNLKKGLLIVAGANILNLVFGLVSNFLLPKYLSIASYADLKTYTLLMTYSSFFSLGFVDGMYLEYGGKNNNEIEKKQLWNEFQTFRYLEIAFSIVILIVGLLISNKIVLFFAFGMYSTAIVGAFRSYCQATGEFKLYGFSLNTEKVILMALYVLILLVLRFDNADYVILAQAGVPFLLIPLFQKKIFAGERQRYIVSPEKQKLQQYIKVGMVLMISNFTLGLLTGIDRWFIKIFLTTEDFAMYSFAVSTESVLGVFLSPITVTMYNYFAQKKSKEDIQKIKNISLLWGFAIITGGFACEFLVQFFLKNYLSSCFVSYILFLSQLFYLMIRGIYVNLYKANKKQNVYMKQVVIFLVLSLVLNYVLFRITGSKEGIAIATLLVSVIWFMFCEFSNIEYRLNIRQYIYIILMSAAYIVLACIHKPIWACLGYICVFLGLSYLMMRTEFVWLLSNAKGIVASKFIKK